MDAVTAVGLVASAEQLAALATTIVCNMYSFYEAVRDAPKRSQELRQEMGAMSDQLNSLAAVLSNDPKHFVSQPTSLFASISELKAMLKDMNERVCASNTKGIRRLKWPFSKDENERLLSRMERYKTTLNTALNIQTA